MGDFGEEFYDDDIDEEVNVESLTVVISHLEDQRFVAKFHEDADVPLVFSAYNPETREYRFKAVEATAVEAELAGAGFNIFRDFSSYEEIVPEVFDQADPVARDDALECVRQGNDVFVTGAGGSGKTEFLRKCLEILGPTVAVAVCSTTGVASEELDARMRDLLGLDNHVTTLYRCLGIRPDDWKRDPSTVVMRVVSARKRDKTPSFDVFMLDEVSMCSAKMFGIAKRVIRTINPDAQIIVAGDFLQLPPVRKEEDPEHLGEFAFHSPEWETLFAYRQFVFEENFRLRGASDRVKSFQTMLDRVRFGEITEEDVSMLEKNHDGEPTDDHYRVYPRVAEARSYNQERLKKLSSPIHVFKSHSVSYEQAVGDKERTSVEDVPPVLRKIVGIRLEKEFVPVEVALGSRIMLTRNHLLETKGVANGSIGTVIALSEVGLTVRFDGKEEEGILIAPTAVDQLDAGVGMDKTRRTVDIVQMPVRLAWAGTIHLVQSRSIKQMYVNFASHDGRSAVFAPGQAYVAISRVVDPEGFLCSGARTLLEDGAVRCSPDALQFYRETLPAKTKIRKAARDAGYSGPEGMYNERLGVPYDRRDTTKEPPVHRSYLTDMIRNSEAKKKSEYHEIKRKRQVMEEQGIRKAKRHDPKDSWYD
jgi:hypothetical protein